VVIDFVPFVAVAFSVIVIICLTLFCVRVFGLVDHRTEQEASDEPEEVEHMCGTT